MFYVLHVGACEVLVLHSTPGPVASSHQNNPLTAAHGHIFTWPATFICLPIYSFLYVVHRKKAVLGLYLLKIAEIM